MAGILLHPTSLPGSFGIGDLGPELDRFLDWMVAAGLGVWQVLPLGPPALGNSPYTALSAFAGNPLMISPELLLETGLLERADLVGAPRGSARVDFAAVAEFKEGLLRRAWERFRGRPGEGLAAELESFVTAPEQEPWLEDFVLFRALAKRSGREWPAWDPTLVRREGEALERAKEELAPEIAYQCFVQMLFARQWARVRRETGRRGIRILGDLPIYVAHESADVWAHPDLFDLDAEGRPRNVAGVPPDYFSDTGQRWGNPLYRWDQMREEGFEWWIRRLESNLARADWVRLDHFRGFVDYWEIPAGEETAAAGRWVSGPGAFFFAALRDRLGPLPLVAEDLGEVGPPVEELRRSVGLPGMRVLQFGMADPKSPHAPHHHTRDSAVFTGTHDNPTLAAWLADLGEEDRRLLREYGSAPPEGEHEAMLRLAYASVGFLAVLPAQDVLGLGAEARMNTPAQPEGNWAWRLAEGQLTPELAARLRRFAELYDRLPSAERGREGA